MKKSFRKSLVFVLLCLSAQNVFADDIADIITNKQNLASPDFTYRSADLELLYSEHQLIWLNNTNTDKNVNDALNLLASASIHGLNPIDYDADTLRSKIPLVAPSGKDLALYDTALSVAMLRFTHDLHYGRVNPKDVNFNLKFRDKIDLPLLIKDSVSKSVVNQIDVAVEPKTKQYQKLKLALASYQKVKPFEFIINKTLLPGGAHPQIAELSQYLFDSGLIQEIVGGEYYNETLVDGVKLFQARNSIKADGYIKKNTVAAFNAPVDQRITKIELAMERLRWLPEISTSIIVNIPAFQLYGTDDQDEKVNMKVVVGKADGHQTPILMADMKYLDFMPYWNVPYSIAKKELLPKLLNNNGYLYNENMEFVSSRSNGSSNFSNDMAAQIRQGSLRIRQRPGGKNALGKVKFMFPNKYNVYMHDTPSKSFFSKTRRDYSHGCVRLGDPKRLAEFVLKNNNGWDSDKINDAMSAPKTRQVTLQKTIPVLFFYSTAFLDNSDNVAFYDDIYGHDAILIEALNKHVELDDSAIFAPPPVVDVEPTVEPAQEDDLGV